LGVLVIHRLFTVFLWANEKERTRSATPPAAPQRHQSPVVGSETTSAATIRLTGIATGLAPVIILPVEVGTEEGNCAGKSQFVQPLATSGKTAAHLLTTYSQPLLHSRLRLWRDGA
jgi:hypothetical protein